MRGNLNLNRFGKIIVGKRGSSIYVFSVQSKFSKAN